MTDEMPARVKRLIIFNHEYRKIICMGSKCGKAIKFEEVRDHLGGTHNVSVGDSSQVTRIARQLGWRKRLWGNVRPEDGSAPQVGLAVRDGFRCPYCRRYVSIYFNDVDDHWEDEHYGSEGSRAERVQFQTWEGFFRDGYYHKYWVVGEEEAAAEDAEPAQEKAMEEDTGPTEEGPVEGRDLKEIPDDIEEGSESWSEVGGQEEREGCKDKERFDEWEGNCFGWRWKEAEYGGRDEMAEDWVVMY